MKTWVQQRWQQDGAIWSGLVLLVLSLGLLAASFSLWRDDLRNLPRPDGSFSREQIHHGMRAHLEAHSVLKAGATLGFFCLVSSCLLLVPDRNLELHDTPL